MWRTNRFDIMRSIYAICLLKLECLQASPGPGPALVAVFTQTLPRRFELSFIYC